MHCNALYTKTTMPPFFWFNDTDYYKTLRLKKDMHSF